MLVDGHPVVLLPIAVLRPLVLQPLFKTPLLDCPLYSQNQVHEPLLQDDVVDLPESSGHRRQHLPGILVEVIMLILRKLFPPLLAAGHWHAGHHLML